MRWDGYRRRCRCCCDRAGFFLGYAMPCHFIPTPPSPLIQSTEASMARMDCTSRFGITTFRRHPRFPDQHCTFMPQDNGPQEGARAGPPPLAGVHLALARSATTCPRTCPRPHHARQPRHAGTCHVPARQFQLLPTPATAKYVVARRRRSLPCLRTRGQATPRRRPPRGNPPRRKPS